MSTIIAVLGTGRMGDAIAHKLLAAGFAVRVWNRTPKRAAAAVAAGAATGSARPTARPRRAEGMPVAPRRLVPVGAGTRDNAHDYQARRIITRRMSLRPHTGPMTWIVGLFLRTAMRRSLLGAQAQDPVVPNRQDCSVPSEPRRGAADGEPRTRRLEPAPSMDSRKPTRVNDGQRRAA
jgi:hypothetical protein